jgi:penicillin-binding protein 1A
LAVVFGKLIFKFRQLPAKRKALLVAGIALLSVPAFFFLLFIMTLSGSFGKLPDHESLALVRNPIASEIYSADSVLIGKYFIQERSNARYDDIPKHLVHALLATEDVRFLDHSGIDYRSLGRVIFKGFILQSEAAGGGSTLTQQLAKNLYPRRKYRLFSLPINKMREMIVARRLERIFSKEDILLLYLNTVPFGENTYGIESAAQRFFSVPVKRLTAEQAAVLVGMLKASHYYNPRLFPERAKGRRDVVLSQMHKYEMIEADEYERLRKTRMVLKYKKTTHHSGLAPYFREHLRSELLEWCDNYNEEHEEQVNLYTSGLKIYTTIDSRLQSFAESSVATQMKLIQDKFESTGDGKRQLAGNPAIIDEALKQSPHYKALVDAGVPTDSIDIILRQPVPMSVFTWEGEKEMRMSPRDSVAYFLQFLNTGLLAMDPHTGAVLTWVGGIDHQFFQFDHVKPTTRRQVGSTFKPIVYAAAVEAGVRPCGYISAERTVYDNRDSWSPENTEDASYDFKYSMPGALAHSVNTVSVKILEKAGIKGTVTLARKMGITSDLDPVPALALGTPSLSMLEMVNAYSCFANGGLRTTPYYIVSVAAADGTVLEKFAPSAPQRALSEETASSMLFMLKRVVDEGTGAGIRSRFGLTNDLAGKTGTTQSNTDGWFIGVLPGMVVGAWVGADNPAIHFKSTALGQGSRTALPIVGSFLAAANRDPSLDTLMRQTFPAIPYAIRSRLDCEMFKPDNNLFRRLSGRKEKKKKFGEEKKGLLKKLFRRDE